LKAHLAGGSNRLPTFAMLQGEHQFSANGGPIMHIPLTFNRNPLNYSAEKSMDGQIFTRPGDGYIGIQFSTNAELKPSHFSAGVGPGKFEALARLMVEVDPQAAIRAFGAAMNDITVQKLDAAEVVTAA
jgi:hypothetical protein